MRRTATARAKANNRKSVRTVSLQQLYELDEVAWLEASSALIRQGRTERLDYPHLAEYLEDMAKRDRREVKNRLVTLLAHLLKWQFRPRKRTRSWAATVLHQRGELEGAVDITTLRHHALAVLPDAYRRAVKEASKETGLKASEFPEECPYSFDFILGDDFPGGDLAE